MGNIQGNLLRPFFYGYGKDGIIHSYTKEEWGMGAKFSSGGNYATHSVALLSFGVLVMLPAALAAILVTIVLVANLNFCFVIALFFAALFSAGVLLGGATIRSEMKARRLRGAKGMPKPRMSATDEQARKWFTEHPSATVPLTPEYFPDAQW